MIQPIRIWSHASDLNKPCRPVHFEYGWCGKCFNAFGLPELVADLLETMFAARGAGLAAPQIGVDARVAVIDRVAVGAVGFIEPLVLVNPEVVSRKGEHRDQEGCLSFVGLSTVVTRPSEVVVRYQDALGVTAEIAAQGLFARALCHEVEHLEGRVIQNHVGPAARGILLGKLRHERERLLRHKNVNDRWTPGGP